MEGKQGKEKNGKNQPATRSAAPPTRNTPTDLDTKKKKKVMVRMTRAQVDRILAYKPKALPEAPQCKYLPQHLQDALNAAFAQSAAAMEALQASGLADQEWVRKQIEEKGYAEYEVDADDAPRLRRVRGIAGPRHPVKHAVGLGVKKTF